MGMINYPNQFNFTGSGYLDSKMKAVPNMAGLRAISPKQLFKGYTVIVLDDGTDFCPCEYWIAGNDRKWTKKYDFGKLNLLYDKEFQTIQIQYGENVCMSSIDLTELFEDRFVEKVEKAQEDDKGNKGTFIKFTYSGRIGEKKVEYISLPETISGSLKQGNGIIIDGETVSLDDAYVDKKIEEKTSSLSSEISKIAGIEKRVTDVEAETVSLKDKISKMTGSKPIIDKKSLEYVEVDPVTKQEELGVKISNVEGNMLRKEEDGLASMLTVSGDDTDTEIIY